MIIYRIDLCCDKDIRPFYKKFCMIESYYISRCKCGCVSMGVSTIKKKKVWGAFLIIITIGTFLVSVMGLH